MIILRIFLLLEEVLGSPRFQLVKASSGKEALKQLLTQDFAVILLDVMMPILDGYETAKLIRQRERSKAVPIIFLTALGEDETHLHKGYSLSAVEYLFKPFNTETLKSKVSLYADLFNRHRRTDSSRPLPRKSGKLKNVVNRFDL